MRAASGLILGLLGTALLVVSVGLEARATWTQAEMSKRLDAITPHSDASAFAEGDVGADGVADATRREAETSGLVGEIEIPRLGLSAVVLEGIAGGTLSKGVGHVPGTGYPGEVESAVLAAHRDTYFRPLKDVVRGDSIWVRTPDGRFGYRVETTWVVLPERTDVLEGAGPGELTLVTCYPFYWVGSAPKRFIVRASPLAPPAVAALTENPN